MQIDKIELTEADLSRIDGVFAATRPGFRKRATVIFTNGKSDPRWRGSKPTDSGMTFPSAVSVNEQQKVCIGACLIDLLELIKESITPVWINPRTSVLIAPAKLSFDQLRYKTVIRTIHELVHIDQGWQIGKRFGRDMLEERISSEARASDYAEKNPEMPNDPYLQNMFEKGARDFTDRWSAVHGNEIHDGKWDFLAPMTTLREMSPDMPNIFR